MFTKTFCAAPSLLHQDRQPDNIHILSGPMSLYCVIHTRKPIGSKYNAVRSDNRNDCTVPIVAVYAANMPLYRYIIRTYNVICNIIYLCLHNIHNSLSTCACYCCSYPRRVVSRKRGQNDIINYVYIIYT